MGEAPILRDPCENRNPTVDARRVWRARGFCNCAHGDGGTLERIHALLPGAPVLSGPVYRETLANAVSLATY